MYAVPVASPAIPAAVCPITATFSWLAAWLSDAEKIYFPLIGDWHPNSPRSKEINLWTDEERYIYYDMKTRKYLTYKSLINY